MHTPPPSIKRSTASPSFLNDQSHVEKSKKFKGVNSLLAKGRVGDLNAN